MTVCSRWKLKVEKERELHRRWVCTELGWWNSVFQAQSHWVNGWIMKMSVCRHFLFPRSMRTVDVIMLMIRKCILVCCTSLHYLCQYLLAVLVSTSFTSLH